MVGHHGNRGWSFTDFWLVTYMTNTGFKATGAKQTGALHQAGKADRQRRASEQRLSHHSPMLAQILRDRANRTSSIRMFPPDLFE